MSPKKSTSNTRKPKAIWNFEEEKLLIEFLSEHIAEAGDGFHFKKTTFQAASNLLEPRRREGGANGRQYVADFYQDPKFTEEIYVAQRHIRGR